MSNLVYLSCSLPSLSYAQAPPISLEEFNDEARNQLSVRDYKKLEKTDIRLTEGKTKNGPVKRISQLFSELQQDVSEWRNAKVQKRKPELLRLEKIPLNLNPLERENQIMQWQWEELDSIVSGKAFTLTEIMVYKLKLQILWRKDSFNSDKGAQVLASVVDPSKKEI
jgi:hypothetical protein